MPRFRPVTRYAAGLGTLCLVAGLGLGSAFAAPSATIPAAATIPLGGAPESVAVDPSVGAVYVTNTDSDNMSVIDAAGTAPIVTPLPLSPPDPEFGSYGVGVDPSTHTAYVATDNNTVLVVNGANPLQPTVTATVSAPQLQSPLGVAVDTASHVAYVTNFGNGGSTPGSVSAITGDPPAVAWTVQVGDAPVGVAVDPTNHLIYVANKDSNTVSVINGAATTPSVIHNIPLPANADNPGYLAVDPSTHTVYVASFGPGTLDAPAVISAISETSNTVEAHINDYNPNGATNTGVFPIGVAVDPSTHAVYVANSGVNARDVAIIDGSDPTGLTLTASVPVGSSPYGIAVNPTTHLVYVANNGDGTVSVIVPPGLLPPGAPSAVRAAPGQDTATVSFAIPSSNGGSPISNYTVRATDLTHSAGDLTEGYSASNVQSDVGVLEVGELFGGDSYTFAVSATNAVGTGPASAPSNTVTVQPQSGPPGICTPQGCTCTPLTCRPVH